MGVARGSCSRKLRHSPEPKTKEHQIESGSLKIFSFENIFFLIFKKL
jgi:hypothetical protein